MSRLTISFTLIFIASLSICLRILPLFLPFADWGAKISVQEQIIQESKEKIQKDYSELPDVLKEELFLREFDQQIRGKDYLIRVKEKANQLRDKFQDKQGIPYLQEVDSYRWLRYIKNLMSKGHIGDRVIQGRQFDDYMLAPKGVYVTPHIGNIWVGYLLHRFFSLFKKDLSLVLTISFVPIILVVVICLISFLISYKSFGIFSGICSSLCIAFSPMFLKRSSFGWFDTDVYNILFPLLILWFSLNLRDSDHFKKKIVSLFFLSLSFGLYSLFWVGWWYIFDMVLMVIFIDGLVSFLIQKNKRQLYLISFDLIILIFLSFFFVSLFLGDPKGFFVFLLKPFSIISELKSPFILDIWPNVYVTVSELRGVTIGEVINLVNGQILFLFSLLGIIILILRGVILKDKKERLLGILLILWTTNSIFASLKAIRFSLILLPPLSIACGISMGETYNWLTQRLKTRWPKRKEIFSLIFVAILSMPLGLSLFDAGVIVRETRPLMNDSWNNLLNKIKEQTPKETIINSWWDYGDWCKAISDRRVIFDAGSQNHPVAYWMARFFLTDNEEEALGILRMLNNGSNEAFEELRRQGIDAVKAIDILNSVLSLPREKAEETLRVLLPENKLKYVLDLTHRDPRDPCILIVDKSIIDKIKSISYLGNWSHRNADIWLKSKSLQKKDFVSYLMDRYKYNSENAEDLYNQIRLVEKKDLSKWISFDYQTYSLLSKGKREGDLVFFDNGLVVNLSNKRARISQRFSFGIPKSLIIFEKENLKEIVYEDADLDFSSLVILEGDEFKSLLLDKGLAKSFIIRLYYLKGQGLRYFKLLYEEKDGDNFIYVYKIDWNTR